MTIATTYERYMLELINAERAKVGAPALQLEQNLNTAADAHSAWMLDVDIFSHTGVDGSSPTKRIRDAQFDLSGGWRTAENIAVQSERGPDGIMDDVANLHTSLMNSPGHRANILNPDLDYIGIGIALGDFDFDSGTYESVIVTQNFASTGGNVDLDTGATQETAQPQIEQVVNAIVAAPEPVEPAPVAQDDPVPEPSEPAPVAQDDPAPEPTPAPENTQEPVTTQTTTQTPVDVTPTPTPTPTPSPAPTFAVQLERAGMDIFDFLVRDDDNADDGAILFGAGLSSKEIAQKSASLTKETFRSALEEFELSLQQASDENLDTVAL
jgi:hypothetical protein